jgi:hypothetical protein
MSSARQVSGITRDDLRRADLSAPFLVVVE